MPTRPSAGRRRALVEAHGRSSLAHIALLGEKQYLFTPGGSVVAYKPVGNVGLALGDPIGPDDDTAAAVAAFTRFCRERAWQPVFYQTRPDTRGHYRDAGLQTTLIGQEAIVDLNAFTVSGGRNKNLRAGVNRMEREGYRLMWHDPPQPPERMHALAAVSTAWLRSRRSAEKEFSLGRFDEAYVAACPVATVEDAEGRVLAFVNLIPEYGRGGLAVDLMRFVDGAPAETMLFLFVRLLERLRDRGLARADLGLSALSGLDASARAPLTERALAAVFERGNALYNFKGLHVFKSKFHPSWEARYLAHPAGLGVLRALEAVAIADSPVGVWGELRLALAQRLRSARPERDGAATEG